MAEEDKDNDATLTQEQILQFIKWVDSKEKEPMACPVCGTQKWASGSLVLYPPAGHPSGGMIIGGGHTYPLIPVICTNCGFTRFFNAIVAGIVKPEEDEKEKPREEKKKVEAG